LVKGNGEEKTGLRRLWEVSTFGDGVVGSYFLLPFIALPRASANPQYLIEKHVKKSN